MSNNNINMYEVLLAKKLAGSGGSSAIIEPLSITENGTYTAPSDIDGYSPVTVDCPEPKPEQTKTVDITSNGDLTITPDVGKVLSSVLAKVNVSGGGGGSPKPFSGIVHRTWTPASDTKDCPISRSEQKDLAMLVVVSDKFMDGYTMSVVCGVKYGFGVLNLDTNSYRGLIVHGESNPFFGDNPVLEISSVGLTDQAYRSNHSFKSGVTYHVILAYGPMDYS